MPRVRRHWNTVGLRSWQAVVVIGAIYGVIEAVAFVRSLDDSSQVTSPTIAAIGWVGDRGSSREGVVLLVALAIAAGLVAAWWMVRSVRRARAGGSDYINQASGFVRVASEVLEGRAGLADVSPVPGLPVAGLTFDAAQLRQKVLESLIAKGNGRAKLRCMYLVPKSGGSTKHRVLVPIHEAGHQPGDVKGLELPVPGSVVGAAFETGKLQRKRNARRHPSFFDAEQAAALGGIIAIPLIDPVTKSPYAVFCVVADRRYSFSALDAAHYRLCASLVEMTEFIAQGETAVADQPGTTEARRHDDEPPSTFGEGSE